ncbi:iron uptake porin, partial [Spirulina sp. 06S082]|uniref:iron uptake porin n=1 Tax=Spirulina sp. 06S082 TaxID=3110248 RepID=UPI002B1F20DC
LDDLVRRYDCLKGYPNGTYRGNRALTRYEFAAGLNACLQQLERVISGLDFGEGELSTLRRLMQEFEAELATLGTRVDNLEGRVAFLEDNQFSTTTKLVGEVIFNLDIATGDRAKIFGFDNADYFDLSRIENSAFLPESAAQVIDRNRMLGVFEDTGVVDSITLGEYLTLNPTVASDFASAIDGVDDSTNFQTDRNSPLAFGYRVRLNFDTSFTGRDRLRTRIQARNLQNISDTGLSTDQADPNKYGNTDNNDIRLSDLIYRFPIGDRVMFHIGATGLGIDDVLDSGTTSPFAADGLPLGLAYNNLFYEIGDPDAGIGANIELADWLRLDVGFMAGNANSATEGIFGGNYVLPVQLNFDLSDDLFIALGYARAYSGENDSHVSATASILGQNPFLYYNLNDASRATGFFRSAISSNHWHLSASWDASEVLNVSAFVGYANAIAESGVRVGDNADYWTWGINFGFPDLFKEDDVLVAGFGMLPYLGSANNGPSDRSPSYMANIEYRFPITDNIEMAPGVYAVFNPNGNPNNDTIFVGMLRTTFSF